MEHAGLWQPEKDAANELLKQYFSYLRTGKEGDLLLKAIDYARKNRWYSVVPLDRIFTHRR
jgi:hypothetical protein